MRSVSPRAKWVTAGAESLPQSSSQNRGMDSTPAGEQFGAAATGIGGMALTLLLCALFSWAEPASGLWLASGTLMVVWGVWAWVQPLQAFAALLFVWVTFYTRASLPLFQVEGGWNRGGVGLGDLLWLIFIAAWLTRRSLLEGWRPSVPRAHVDPLLLLLTPYLLLSVLLPIAGVLVWGYPPSYAIPGARHLQWVSFTLLGYWFCQRYGMASVTKAFLTALVLAGVAHTLYALVQLLAPLGVLPGEWLLPDQVFAQRFTTTWFFYPRTTGLLVNPNSYGLFGSVVLIFLGTLLLARVRVGAGIQLLLGLTGVWAVATSASRSAIVGLLMAGALMGFAFLLKAAAPKDERSLTWLVGFLLKTLLAAGVAATVAFLFLPPHLTQRVMLLVGVITEGLEVDPNAIGRLEFWEGALRAFEEQAPLGTWVPAGYALDTPIDSYYVSLLVQGTPLYLFAFLMLLFGTIWRGLGVLPTTSRFANWTGFAMIGIGALIGGASFTLSPLLETQTLVPFWLLIGIGLATQRP